MLPKDTKVKIVMHWVDENGVKRPVAELDNIDLETNDKVLAELDYVRVVRCKDCKYRYVDGDNVRVNFCELNHNKVQGDDWFCADGERREEE